MKRQYNAELEHQQGTISIVKETSITGSEIWFLYQGGELIGCRWTLHDACFAADEFYYSADNN